MQRNGVLWVGVLCLGFAASVGPPSALGQFHEAFESPTHSWIRGETDCILPASRWTQRRRNDLSDKNRFERIQFETGPGTRILVAHDITPAFVISELKPSVRIKASDAGIRMMVRVVLPHTPAISGDGVMTTLISGPATTIAEQWQEISFAHEPKNLQEKLQEEIWLLRRKHGSHVTDRDAYIDKVVLNIYTGQGRHHVEIDDLKVDGVVGADKIATRIQLNQGVRQDSQVRPAGMVQSDEKRESLVRRDGTVLLVRNRPFLPLMIESNGESFEFLQSLGFNVVQLKTTATESQLDLARQLNMWIVCPPPASIGINPIGFEFDRVLAWSVGEELTGRQLQTVQQRIREIRESDLRQGRPIFGGAKSNWIRFAQQFDILGVGLQPIGTSFLASQYSDWIRQRAQSVTHSKPVWVDIQTELSEPLNRQISALATTVPPTPIEPQQLKFLVYEAISGGARGLRFRSRTRLDAPDPSSRLRQLTIQWINADIERLTPWIVGGALRGQVPTSDPELEVTAISTNRSRLLLIQRPTHHEQYVAGDCPLRSVTFQDADSTFTDRALLISETSLESLPNTRNLGGNQIRIENCPYTAAIIMTQDPMVTTRLNQTYQRPNRQSSFEMRTEMTRQWLAIMQLINNQMARMGRGTPAASGALNEAINSFRTVSSLIASNSPQAAVKYLDQTDERLAFARREMVTEPLGMFQSKTSSPLVSHASLVPLHWELVGRLDESSWQPNGLAGGDFENLQHMMRSGWENRRLDTEQVMTKVELSEVANVKGQLGLKMTVQSRDPQQPIDATPLWISTPSVSVRGGQMVRIHGWINIPNVIQGNPDGLMIIDSLGGEAMAERIPITNGWQEFTLYRGVESQRDVSVTFALTGVGEAFIDEVTIRAVDLPSLRQARAGE